MGIILKKWTATYTGTIQWLLRKPASRSEKKNKMSWAAYGIVTVVMESNISLHLKSKIYNQCIPLLVNYWWERYRAIEGKLLKRIFFSIYYQDL